MLFFDFRGSPALAKPVLEIVEAFDELSHAAGGGGHDFRIQEAAARRQAAAGLFVTQRGDWIYFCRTAGWPERGEESCEQQKGGNCNEREWVEGG